MKLSTKYSIGDSAWINGGWSTPVRGTVTAISISKQKIYDNSMYDYSKAELKIGSKIYVSYTVATPTNNTSGQQHQYQSKAENEMYDNKLELVKLILGVDGDFDEALI